VIVAWLRRWSEIVPAGAALIPEKSMSNPILKQAVSAGAGRDMAKMDGTGKLSNKIALITGGTTGIGAATATCFQAEGAKVIVTGSDPTTLQVAQGKVPGIEVIASEAAHVAATKRLVENLKATHGRIDVLFVNAGISRFKPISMIDEAFFDTQFGINVRGAYFVMKHAIEIMPDGGSIILTSSASGALGVAGQTVYGATKAAVRSFGRSLARELAPRRIRVNTISPGPIETPIHAKAGMQPGEMASIDQQIVPLARMGRAEEVASVALFLASEDASYITGAELFVDGGLVEL
jgi:NAD(P)-dependent dehydrogenase (short-subunit alcohol dehydrogenase family)